MKNAYSAEHLLYLKKRKRRSALVVGLRLGLLVLFLGIWELFADLEICDPFVTSSPSRIIATIATLYTENSLFYHIGVTLSETLVGFFLAVLLGTGLALLLWWNDLFRRVAEPYLVVLNALPKIALGPLIIIWFGTGSNAIIFMTVLVGIILSVMHMLSAFTSTEENKILLLKSMGATKRQILQKLVIPASLPAFFSMLKINVGMAWIGSIMGEYIVSRAGLGYLIVYGGQVFRLDLVMSATLILCLLAAGMYFLVAAFEKAFVKNKEGR